MTATGADLLATLAVRFDPARLREADPLVQAVTLDGHEWDTTAALVAAEDVDFLASRVHLAPIPPASLAGSLGSQCQYRASHRDRTGTLPLTKRALCRTELGG